MIRLDRVELLHWDVQPHQLLVLADGVTLITGENGSGKTSILDALKVGLGAARLGDRRIESYLLRQARPLAMVRIVVDNRARDGRRRPFDVLGEHRGDLVTLAVVMRQEEESTYRREYYILDGDVVPAVVTGDKRPAKSAQRVLGHRDYLERLRRVGIGSEYLKLLCMPQGGIAGFCAAPPAKLFDDLFDVIGGRDALDEWVRCKGELEAERREHDQVAHELARRRLELELLGEKAKRHEAWVKLDALVGARRMALPHAQIRDAEQRLERQRREEQAAQRELDARDRELADAREHLEQTTTRRGLADALVRDAEVGLDAATLAKDEAVEVRARADAELARLERIRQDALGLEPRDLERLAADLERLREAIARGDAERSERAREQATIAAELETIARGLASYPPDVVRFGDALRVAGIAHHLLAEVLEVRDAAWSDAIEAYLGRMRLAVLVQDPERWAHAAALARTHRFEHGVLAPDVKGWSPADEEGLNAMVEVGEPRYRALVARLLRRVVPGEPPLPLAPASREELLATDGFVVTRLEARHAVGERHYLGRAARERRQRELEARRALLIDADAAWASERAALRDAVQELELAIAAERRRRAWELAQGEHTQASASAAKANEHLQTCKSELDLARQFSKEAERARTDASVRVATADARAAHLGEQRAVAADRLERVEGTRRNVEGELGVLVANAPASPGPELQAVLEGFAFESLKKLVEEGERELGETPADVKDTMLPLNHRRQLSDVVAIETRLTGLVAQQEATQAAAEAAHKQYKEATQRVFRSYFARLDQAARDLDWTVDGRIQPRDDGRFVCVVRVAIGDKAPVAYDSEELSGGQKAALSILMGMTGVSLEVDGAAFFIIDEPFSASDVTKMNELGRFLARTGAQYLLSMPTSSDIAQLGPWLAATWTCTRSRGGVDARGRPLLAAPVKVSLAGGARVGVG